MNIWVTGESSSFSKSFNNWCNKTNKHVIVNNDSEYDYFRQKTFNNNKEIDIFDPTLNNLISKSNTDIIIHKLPISEDEADLFPDYTLNANIRGTWHVLQIAKELQIPLFLLTSANSGQVEDLYNITAVTANNLAFISKAPCIIVEIPIIYGSEYNTGISGLIKSAFGNESATVNYELEKEHDFMYDSDFFDALDVVINKSFDYENYKILQNKIQISQQDSSTLENVITILENKNLYFDYIINPEKDILIETFSENISVQKLYGFRSQYSLTEGIQDLINKLGIKK
jgi:nucleoside-diphosphate-sugar epimerase